jgi:hypothetical protein
MRGRKTPPIVIDDNIIMDSRDILVPKFEQIVAETLRFPVPIVLSMRGRKTPPIVIDDNIIMDSRDILVPIGFHSINFIED